MYSVCSAGNCCIHPGINEQPCSHAGLTGYVDATHDLQRASSQFDKFPRVKVLFAQLNRIDTRVHRLRNMIEQQSHALIVTGGKLSAIGYVVEKQFSTLTEQSACDATLRDIFASFNHVTAGELVVQLIQLLLIAIPIANISWTITHDGLGRET